MIGLKRGTVELVPYKKAWSFLFEEEKRELKRILGNKAIDIRHVGSTAIPGMDAKPIIDIILGVKELRRDDEIEAKLRSIGYEFRHQNESEILYVKGTQEERTHHLHILKYNGRMWKSYMLFRDFMIRNKEWAEKYKQLKQELAKKYAENREFYTTNKKMFIEKVIHHAEKT